MFVCRYITEEYFNRNHYDILHMSIKYQDVFALKRSNVIIV